VISFQWDEDDPSLLLVAEYWLLAAEY